MLGPVGQLLSDPERWTKKASGRTESGEPTSFSDPLAVCFCLAGAIAKCYPDEAEMSEANGKVYEALGGKRQMVGFNDSPKTTHADLMAVLENTGI